MSKLRLFDLNNSSNTLKELSLQESNLIMGGQMAKPSGTIKIDTTCVIKVNEDGVIVCECG